MGQSSLYWGGVVGCGWEKEGQPFLYAKLLRNGTVDPPSVPTKQALIR